MNHCRLTIDITRRPLGYPIEGSRSNHRLLAELLEWIIVRFSVWEQKDSRRTLNENVLKLSMEPQDICPSSLHKYFSQKILSTNILWLQSPTDQPSTKQAIVSIPWNELTWQRWPGGGQSSVFQCQNWGLYASGICILQIANVASNHHAKDNGGAN